MKTKKIDWKPRKTEKRSLNTSWYVWQKTDKKDDITEDINFKVYCVGSWIETLAVSFASCPQALILII